MYTEKERRVFGPYFNGARDVYADPLQINRRLKQALGGDPNDVIQKYNSPIDEIRHEAAERLMAAVRVAFDMVPFDVTTGRGALEDDCVKVINHYLNWIEDRRSFSERPPTSPPSSASAAGPATKSTSAST